MKDDENSYSLILALDIQNKEIPAISNSLLNEIENH